MPSEAICSAGWMTETERPGIMPWRCPMVRTSRMERKRIVLHSLRVELVSFFSLRGPTGAEFRLECMMYLLSSPAGTLFVLFSTCGNPRIKKEPYNAGRRLIHQDYSKCNSVKIKTKPKNIESNVTARWYLFQILKACPLWDRNPESAAFQQKGQIINELTRCQSMF